MHHTHIISLLVVILASAGIFTGETLYAHRINKLLTVELIGMDCVGLLTAIVMFLTTNSSTGQIVRLGCLSYFIYTYGYYSFGLVSSVLYILYICVFSMSLFAFIHQFNDTMATFVAKPQFPRGVVAGFNAVVAIIMIIIGGYDLIKITIVNGDSLTPDMVFYIFDQAIIFPSMLIAAYRTINDDKMGQIMAGLLIVKTITLLPAVVLADCMYWMQEGVFRDASFDIISICIISTAIVVFAKYRAGIA